MVHLKEVESSFWGLTLENEKRYSQTVEKAFHISMAALEPRSDKKAETVCVMIQSNDAEFLLCSLSPSLLQQPLNLNFKVDEEVTFFLSGHATISGRVHLTGFLEPEELEFDEMTESEEEEDSEELESDPGSDEEMPRLKALKSAEKSTDDSDDETVKAGGKRKKKQQKSGQVKKRLMVEQAEEVDSDASDLQEDDDSDDENDIMDINELLAAADDTDDEDDEDYQGDEFDLDDSDNESGDDTEGSFLAKADKKKNKKDKSNKQEVKSEQNTPDTEKKKNKKKKQDSNNISVNATPNQVTSQSEPETPSTDKKKKKKKKKNKNKDAVETPKQDKENTTPKSGGKPKKMSLQGGVIAEELKEGHGPAATPGKMTAVHYIGKLLSNNKEFDRTRGTPFKFKLGKGEVIKGWDVGVKGMKVGGKRRLTVPAKMGYGNQRAGEIPPNSTLVFDVELKSVS